MGRQGLPLRGHREDTNSRNRGNFLEISDYFARYDDKFKANYTKPKNYCSPSIQNELIEISANFLTNTIIQRVKKCGFYSLMVHEARCFKEEQLSIVIRFTNELEVEERFLGFVDCSSDRDSSALQNLLLEFFEKNGLADIPIIGQSYDGANVMSGYKNGLLAKIKESNPQAVFIHCLAHRLNLVVVDSCSNIRTATSFFNTIEALYIHFSKPGNNSELKKVCQSLQLNIISIISLSTTRWSCRYENCKSIANNFVLIKNALEKEISEGRYKNAVEALGILTSITKPDFIENLHIFNFALQTINVLNKFFQTKDATLGQAYDSVEATITTFKNNRDNFLDIWTQIEQFANDNDISQEPLRISKRKKGCSLEKDFYIDSTLGKDQFLDLPNNTSTAEYWKINIYYPVIDNITSNLEYRFQSIPFAKSVNSFFKLDLEESAEFINNYKDILKIDSDSLKAEVIVFRNLLNATNENCVNVNLLKSKIYKNIYPNSFKLLQVAISLPISSAGCE